MFATLIVKLENFAKTQKSEDRSAFDWAIDVMTDMAMDVAPKSNSRFWDLIVEVLFFVAYNNPPRAAVNVGTYPTSFV